MDLKHLTDQCLLDDTKNLANKERHLVTVILRHLAEIQKRRLFSKVGCSSLFTYCTDVLRYSEAQAHQKISAMRLMLEVPELEKKIEKGEISVTNVAQAQSFFNQENKTSKIALSVEKKREVLKKLESTSTRQGQRILLSLSSQPATPVVERERQVSSDLTEIRFAANDDLLAKLKKLKGLMAHKKENMSYGELIVELCEISLEKLDPVRKAERAQRRQSAKVVVHSAAKMIPVTSNSTSCAKRKGALDPSTRSTGGEMLRDSKSSKLQSGLQGLSSKRGVRGISAAVRHQVWQRAKGVCENCNSQHALQLDLRVPHAFGGHAEGSNIRVLCRSCNQRAAIEKFGLGKMNPFFDK